MFSIVLALSVFLSTDTSGYIQQDIDYCDSVLSHASTNWKSIDSFSLKMLFKAVCSRRCSNNVEFEEVSNELLFRLLWSKPALFFSTLFKMSQEEVAIVKQQIDHPVHDGIPVVRIYEDVRKSRLSASTKEKALQFMHHIYEQEREAIRAWEKKNKTKWEYPSWSE